MSFRIVTQKEFYNFNGGMRLTFPTLGAMLKYPWTNHNSARNKFSCFTSEFNFLNDVGNKMNLICKEISEEHEKCEYAPHPLAYLVEAADDICYKILDIEDAIELGILSKSFLENTFKKDLDLEEHEKELLKNKYVSYRIKNALIRGKTMEKLIEEVLNNFKSNYNEIMEGQYYSSLLKGKSNHFSNLLDEAYNYVVQDVYTVHNKTILEIGAFAALGNMLEIFSEAAYEICCIQSQEEWSYKTKRINDLLGNNVPIDMITQTKDPLFFGLMNMLDYIAGMTNQFATTMNHKLCGLG